MNSASAVAFVFVLSLPALLLAVAGLNVRDALRRSRRRRRWDRRWLPPESPMKYSDRS